MPKQSYRPRPRPAPRRAPSSSVEPQAADSAQATLREPSAAPAAAAPKKQVDFASEYRYVLGDLRKMGIIAVAMFVVLIAVSFAVR